MPLLGFKKQFAPAVELGLAEPSNLQGKRQTIRAYRKDGRDPKAGDTLYLYTGLRTKAARKLGEAVCKSVDRITIYPFAITINEKPIPLPEEYKIAIADGFKIFADFADFFRKTHGLPFFGLLIKW